MRALHNLRGFGLLGTMIALVLLSIAVVALTSAGVYAVAARTQSTVRSEATAIAVSYLEEVKTREAKTIVSEAAVTVDKDGAADEAGPYVRSLEVLKEENLENAMRITVIVEYPTGRERTGKVKLVTILYQGRY